MGIDYTSRNCNLANLRGMFHTCLLTILACLENNDIACAKHRIEQILKSLERLKEHNGKE